MRGEWGYYYYYYRNNLVRIGSIGTYLKIGNIGTYWYLKRFPSFVGKTWEFPPPTNGSFASPLIGTAQGRRS
jgi:hypothetical protein